MTKDGNVPPSQDDDSGFYRTETKTRKDAQMKRTQLVTSRLEDISSDFVKMASYGCNATDRLATPEYKALHRAYEQGGITAWKYMATPKDARGCIYVHKAEADAILRRRETAAQQECVEATSQPTDDIDAGGVTQDDQIRLAVIALCQMNNSMSELLGIVTRLARACEGMATAWGEKQQAEEAIGGCSVFDN